MPPGPPRPEVLAQTRFAERRAELEGLPHRELFTRIWQTNLWGADTSVSGLGSEDAATTNLRRDLPGLLRHFGVTTLLDLPCGDFGWMSRTDHGLRRYLGADIVGEIVASNSRRHATTDGRVAFARLDLLSDPLPAMDAILCRDGLVHLSFANVERALARFRASGARYLIATTFTAHEMNSDIADGDWRMLNLTAAPFCLPRPLALIDEGCTEAGGAYADKALGVWDFAGAPA